MITNLRWIISTPYLQKDPLKGSGRPVNHAGNVERLYPSLRNARLTSNLDAKRPNVPESSRSAHCVLDYGKNASMQRNGVDHKPQRSLQGPF